MTGRTLAHYRLLEKLGEGGMGRCLPRRGYAPGPRRGREDSLDRESCRPPLPRPVLQEARLASSLNPPDPHLCHGLE